MVQETGGQLGCAGIDRLYKLWVKVNTEKVKKG